MKKEKGKSKALGPSSVSVGHPDTLRNTNVINEEGKAKALDLSILQVLRVLQAFRALFSHSRTRRSFSFRQRNVQLYDKEKGLHLEALCISNIAA